MNQDIEGFALDDRPFLRDLDTGEILKDPATGTLLRVSREEHDAYLSTHRRKAALSKKRFVGLARAE